MDKEIKHKLRQLIATAASKIDRTSFWQEPHYTSALFGKLHNEIIKNDDGQYVHLMFSASNDRGPNSAENATGVDIGLVFKWIDINGKEFEKAVLLQAKNHLMNLKKADQESLEGQCKRMAEITSSYVVMDCPYDGSIPVIFDQNSDPPFWTPPPILFDNYIIDYILECKRGDTDDRVIEVAKRADRQLTIKTNAPRPRPKPKPAKRTP
ncbi:hypothetical protein [Xanthomonas sacchari]|uniref:hypothetical protein n=1 Tax=Xanthomonas sacchari TaxID=56458 RepID=UPI00225E6E9B|nr:hypothetical protein [Xanthomonas sacchari]